MLCEASRSPHLSAAPSDFEGHSQEVTIREGEQRVMVEIPIVNDASLEEEEVFSVTVTIIRVPDDVRERIDVCGNSSVIVRIPDDDSKWNNGGRENCGSVFLCTQYNMLYFSSMQTLHYSWVPQSVLMRVMKQPLRSQRMENTRNQLSSL